MFKNAKLDIKNINKETFDATIEVASAENTILTYANRVSQLKMLAAGRVSQESTAVSGELYIVLEDNTATLYLGQYIGIGAVAVETVASLGELLAFVAYATQALNFKVEQSSDLIYCFKSGDDVQEFEEGSLVHYILTTMLTAIYSYWFSFDGGLVSVVGVLWDKYMIEKNLIPTAATPIGEELMHMMFNPEDAEILARPDGYDLAQMVDQLGMDADTYIFNAVEGGEAIGNIRKVLNGSVISIADDEANVGALDDPENGWFTVKFGPSDKWLVELTFYATDMS